MHDGPNPRQQPLFTFPKLEPRTGKGRLDSAPDKSSPGPTDSSRPVLAARADTAHDLPRPSNLCRSCRSSSACLCRPSSPASLPLGHPRSPPCADRSAAGALVDLHRSPQALARVTVGESLKFLPALDKENRPDLLQKPQIAAPPVFAASAFRISVPSFGASFGTSTASLSASASTVSSTASNTSSLTATASSTTSSTAPLTATSTPVTSSATPVSGSAPSARSTSSTSPDSVRADASSLNSLNPRMSHDHRPPSRQASSRASSPRPHGDPSLTALLGPGANTWNFSDESLVQALQLRSEQERTKQEFYRLEIWQRSLQFLQEAINYKVAPSAIPVMFQSTSGPQLPPASAAGAATGDPQITQSLVAAAAAATAASVGAYSDESPRQEHSHIAGPVPVKPSSKPGLAASLNIQGDRERFPVMPQSMSPGHSRNMSQPPAPLQSVPFRPGHQHHASMSAIPSYSGGSPGRISTTSLYNPAASRSSWQAQGHLFPAPVQPSTVSPSSPSSLQQHITFHHWTPNQGGPKQQSPGQTSPRREGSGGTELMPGGDIKRRKSIIERAGSPSPKGPSTASTAALAHSSSRRRPAGHSRHRSEASVLRGDLRGDSPAIRSWAASQQSAASYARQSQGEPQSGVSVLANLAVAESDRERQAQEAQRAERRESRPRTAVTPPAQGQESAEDRQRKHDVDFMISQQPRAS